MLARLRLPFSLGLGGRLGSGQQWMPWIHLDDQVGLIDFLLQQDDCKAPVNACAPNLLRNTEFKVKDRISNHGAKCPTKENSIAQCGISTMFAVSTGQPGTAGGNTNPCGGFVVHAACVLCRTKFIAAPA